MNVTHTVIASPVGELTVVAHDDAVAGLYFEDQRRRPAPDALGEPAESPLFDEVRRQLAEYFAGDRATFDLPLRAEGEPFEQRVWALLPAIPYGETCSYGDLARQLGDVGLAQAVGAANGRNPLCVLVPCHRVVGADGGLTGYAGGLARKRFLLDLEEPSEARLF